MPSAELTSTQAPQQLVAGLDTPHPRSPHTVVSSHGAGFGPVLPPEAVGREATAQSTAQRSRGPAAFRAIGLWLLRVLANSAGAWALAAGAPPLVPWNAGASADDALGAEAEVYLGYGSGRPVPGDDRGLATA